MKLFEHAFHAMGGPCEFKLYSDSSSFVKEVFHALENEVRRIEIKYSRYDNSSIVSKINLASGSGKYTPIDPETAGLVDYADKLYDQSNGLFDASSGVLRKAWDFKSGQLPENNELEQALALVGWENVEFDHEKIRLLKPGMEIDFGGFGKEYATDKCTVIANSMGIQHGLINLGGDLRVLGKHPDNSPWIVGIQHPRKKDIAIANIELHQGAIATSGDYERFMIIDGCRYCHLLNPTTGMSIQPAFASVSVIADACLIAGSFSTLSMLKSTDNPNWIESVGLPYLSIDQNLVASGSIAT